MSIGGLSVGVQTCNLAFILWARKKKISSCSYHLTLTRKILSMIVSFRAKPHFRRWPIYSEQGINSKDY